MKKIYFFLMTFVMTMVCSLQANAIKVTIKVDKPEAVIIKANYAPIEGDVQAVNELDVAEYSYIEVVAKDGYKLNPVTNDAGTPVGSLYANWSTYVYAQNEGDVYNVSTILMSEYRNASCWIKVDQASAVRIVRSGVLREEVTDLQDGQEVEVCYNSAEELPLMIASRTGVPLYEVTFNGTKVEQTSNSTFDITPTNEHGDKINVTSQFPEDMDCQITFEFTHGDKDFFTSILADGTEKVAECEQGFTMKAGKQLTLTGNIADYKFNSMTIGTSQVPYFYGSFSTYITGDTHIVVDVEKYRTFAATLNIDNADAVTVFTNEYDTDSKIDIVNGDNPIQVSEQSNTLYFKANAGYYVTKFEANGEDLLESNYNSYSKVYRFSVEDGMTVNIETAEITYDDKMVVYLNVEPSELTYFTFINSGREEYKDNLKKGYNTIGFSQGTQNPFSWSWYNGNSDGLVYINGNKVEPTYPGSANYNDKTIQNGDVIKLYIGETQEKTYDVTIQGNTELAVIKQDLITPVESTDASITVLPGTRYTFTAIEGKQIKVKVGETELVAEDGVYTYDVNENTTFSISERGTGIDDIEGTDSTRRNVYNMQGVRITSGKLPAGMYVIDGKKAVIK